MCRVLRSLLNSAFLISFYRANISAIRIQLIYKQIVWFAEFQSFEVYLVETTAAIKDFHYSINTRSVHAQFSYFPGLKSSRFNLPLYKSFLSFSPEDRPKSFAPFSCK